MVNFIYLFITHEASKDTYKHTHTHTHTKPNTLPQSGTRNTTRRPTTSALKQKKLKPYLLASDTACR